MADFLKRRREALQPEDLGLERGPRRRTSGLRREEVALLAHMSADFYARLEQRRGARPSESTVAALSRALQLTSAERDHLFSLAGHTPPAQVWRSQLPSPGLLRVLERLDAPAIIVSDLFVTLSQNRLSRALLGVQTQFQGLRRSLVYRWFTEPATRLIHHPEERPRIARSCVASIRAVHGRSENDPEVRQLVAALMTESAEFVELWERHEVANRMETHKRFIHPVVGPLTLDCQNLSGENLSERLVVFTAVTAEDQRKLDELSACYSESGAGGSRG
jgi:hypothetical protein